MTPTERMPAMLTTQPRRRVDFELLAQAADEDDSYLLTSPLRRRLLSTTA